MRNTGMLGRLAVAVVLASLQAGCDAVLVDPGPAPETSVALALAPGSPDFAVAPASANRIRVQVVRGGEVLLDTALAFDPERDDFVVPVRFSAREATVQLRVEISADARPLLRGTTELRLLQRRVTDAEVALFGAQVYPLESAGALAAGVYHSCATAGEAGLYCWGNNDDGQLGNSKFRAASLAEPIEGSGGFYDIGAGFLTTCGLAFEGAAFCWGDNEYGSLGAGSSIERSTTPVPVVMEGGFAQLTVGGLHACGLDFEGRAFCWGFNGFGQLGDGTTTDRPTPVAAAPQLRFSSISAGYVHTCGITTGGAGYCWGLNDFGQLGDGTTNDASAPVAVSGVQGLMEISAGGLHSCALARSGEAWCWGLNGSGQLGDGSTNDHALPAPVEGASFVALSAGGLHTCGLDEGGAARCWGYNGSGALGDDTRENRSTPVSVTGGLSYSRIDAGLHHTCAIEADGPVVCWGYNRFGQLGDGSRANRAEPDEVLFGEPFFTESTNDRGEFEEGLAALLQGRIGPVPSLF